MADQSVALAARLPSLVTMSKPPGPLSPTTTCPALTALSTTQALAPGLRSVGMVTAAPYGGDWFHAHFGISREPLRLIGWYGPNNHRKDKAGVPGEKDTDEGAIDVTEGGTAIPYWLEDPFLRKEYEETLRKEGVASKMEEGLYHPPEGAQAAE